MEGFAGEGALNPLTKTNASASELFGPSRPAAGGSHGF